MAPTPRAGLGLLALASVLQLAAAAPPVSQVLRDNGFSLWLRLMEPVGFLPDEHIPAGLPVTLLAPTDKAVTEFARAMSLSVDELARTPALVDTLLSYSLLPGAALTGSKLAAGGPPRLARSANPAFSVELFRAPGGGLAATDVQGNVAALSGGWDAADRVRVYGASRVLLNGDVFTSPAAFLTFYPRFSALAALTKRVGLWPTLQRSDLDRTLFAPSNAALRADGGAAAAAEAGGLSALLRYHVVQGSRRVPYGFKAGVAVPTLLAGNTLSLRYGTKRVAVAGTNGSLVLTTADVVPEAGSPGKPARIVMANVFAGRATIHGIDRVLLPRPQAGRRLLWRGGFARYGGGGGFAGGFDGRWRGGADAFRAPAYWTTHDPNSRWGLQYAAARAAAAGAGYGESWGAWGPRIPAPIGVPVPAVADAGDYNTYDTNYDAPGELKSLETEDNGCYNC
ncbi:hypothetical protein HT031_006446 [Scenedesmus sp. PABB004]|nr:hypothetical protein HT031_006446 [Scenedesmus sp. PABB004]